MSLGLSFFCDKVEAIDPKVQKDYQKYIRADDFVGCANLEDDYFVSGCWSRRDAPKYPTHYRHLFVDPTQLSIHDISPRLSHLL